MFRNAKGSGVFDLKLSRPAGIPAARLLASMSGDRNASKPKNAAGDGLGARPSPAASSIDTMPSPNAGGDARAPKRLHLDKRVERRAAESRTADSAVKVDR